MGYATMQWASTSYHIIIGNKHEDLYLTYVTVVSANAVSINHVADIWRGLKDHQLIPQTDDHWIM